MSHILSGLANQKYSLCIFPLKKQKNKVHKLKKWVVASRGIGPNDPSGRKLERVVGTSFGLGGWPLKVDSGGLRDRVPSKWRLLFFFLGSRGI